MPDGVHLATLAVEAFAFGCANSLHCVGMCGPLALLAGGRPRTALAYHAARTASYALAGGLAGALGLALGAGDHADGAAWFSFVLALALLAIACGLDKHLAVLPGLGSLAPRLARRAGELSAGARALWLGALTPLLPCGLLFAACAAAIAAGGPLAGATSMAAFALGAIPLLAIAQWQLPALTRRLGPVRVRRAARLAMLLTAALLAWRGAADLAARAGGAPGGCAACAD